jgi:transmembrane sensor
MSSETMNWEAIARYLAGESPAEEQAAVRQWLANHPADAGAIAALDDVLDRVALKPELVAAVDVEAALARVNSRRHEVIPLRRRRIHWVPLAAAAAGLVIAAAIWGRTAAKRESSVTRIAARTLTTPVGGRDSLVLLDGSQVVLGPGSELTIAEGFGQSERRVSVRGEALFTVVHDGKRPFVVAANGSEIRDVGTAFVVHSDGGGVRVAVTEGVIELTPPGRAATTLRAGDAASVSSTGLVTEHRGAGAADDLAWTRGRLVFHDTPLSDVAEDLKRWYGVDLDIRDPALRRRPLSATFQGDSLASVLTTIAQALGATIERHGDTAVVRTAR